VNSKEKEIHFLEFAISLTFGKPKAFWMIKAVSLMIYSPNPVLMSYPGSIHFLNDFRILKNILYVKQN